MRKRKEESSNDMITASVIVATYNRAESLRDTLDALAAQSLPANEKLEILVIDNNSTDPTQQVVSEFAAKNKPSFPPIRYLFEPQQGKSFALNLGIQKAAGEFLLFTDDDVLPDPAWAAALLEIFRTTGADCVGGKIEPLWLSEPPSYVLSPALRPLFWNLYGLLDHGKETVVWDGQDPNFLYGSSIAVRKNVFQKIGLFRTDLGRRGTLLLAGEETDLIQRMFSAGLKVVYTPEAVVRHKVESERLSLRYVRRNRYDSGRSHFVLTLRRNPRPGRFVILCLRKGMEAVCHYLLGRREQAIAKEFFFWFFLGKSVEGIRFQATKILRQYKPAKESPLAFHESQSKIKFDA